MPDYDDRRGQGWYERSGRRGWRGEDDDTQEAHSYGDERRSWDPPYGDERTYGRQGQRGGNYGGSYEGGEGPGRYPRGGGSYGQQDYSRSAQRSPAREGYRYYDTGQAGRDEYEAMRERGSGGYGGYSGYGSSGQGQYGPGGFARGGYGASGYGSDYGQGVYRGGEYDRQRGGYGQYSSGEGGYGQGDLSTGGGYEGVYGEGAGRSGRQSRYGETTGQSGRPVRSYEAYSGGGDTDDRAGHHEFDPDYLEWRRNQLASYDRDYHHWREQQARTHDEDYRRWREERRRKFHEDFHGWRQGRTGPGLSQSPISPSTTGVSYTGQSPRGGGATSGFATHEISGATNADLSRETSSGPTPGFGGELSGSQSQTRIQPSGDGGPQDASRSASPARKGAARATDPAIQNIADGGEGRADLHKDEDEDKDGGADRR